MKRGRAESILDEVSAAVKQWPDFAAQAKVSEVWMKQIQQNHRLEFSEG
jgi:hypothetical protein